MHDSDCPGSTCNMFTKNCAYTVDERENGFLQCMLDNVDLFVLNVIEQNNGIPSRLTAGDAANFNAWKTKFTVNDCSTGRFPLPLGLRHAYRYDKGTITPPIPKTYFGCYDQTGYWFCMDQICTMPFLCDNFLTPAGGFPRFWNEFTYQPASCTGMLSCNSLHCRPQQYASFVSEVDAKRNCTNECLFRPDNSSRPASFCGACENSWNCFDASEALPGQLDTQPACQTAANLCYLVNGTVLAGLTPQQCNALNSCTEKCWKNGNWTTCDTQSECETYVQQKPRDTRRPASKYSVFQCWWSLPR